MIASPVFAMATSLYFGLSSGQSTLVLWLETFGVAAFVAYWATKTFEMRESDAEKRALNARLKREAAPPAAPPGASAPDQESKGRDGEKVVPAG